MSIRNVLADRYASAEMTEIFDQRNRVVVERRFWVAVLKAQIELGLAIDPAAVADYEKVIEDVDLASIEARDRLVKHDVKARLDEFSDLAGHQDVHKGLTSRDLTENVEQLLTWRALELVESRTVALLSALAELAAEHASVAIVGRTHNVPAQPTTIGKRMAQIGEELLAAHRHLVSVQQGFAIRGIKGPVGSQQDQLDLLGSIDKVDELESRVADYLGIPAVLGAVGQVYPRSRDFEVVSSLLQLGSAPSNLAISVRLMAGHDLATEGFKPGQVGSSAMPHKMNTRSCERVNGLFTILRGYLTMASSLAGDQWNEGDVSCSVVRRVVMPDSFFAIDGLYETTFAVLRDFGVFPEVITNELRQYLPFLATTKLLIHAVRDGLGREEAHEVIKTHAVAAALEMREGEDGGAVLLKKLAEDKKFPGQMSDLEKMVADPTSLLGTIDSQIERFCSQVAVLTANRPDSAYRGSEIL
ncbi:MAG: adenylosuccinate lyase [Acidimicrobiales bacterium]